LEQREEGWKERNKREREREFRGGYRRRGTLALLNARKPLVPGAVNWASGTCCCAEKWGEEDWEIKAAGS